jgi:[CysO sulfur-carrier protein]-S-L-cysteine hydrolase
VLTIDAAILEAIVAHARRDHPDEACGVVAGKIGSDVPERLIEMDNAERSSTFYRFDSMEQLRVWREMDERDEEPVVIYHSHTATEAYPSRTDVSYAGEPGAHYLLVSTRDPHLTEVRSFSIVDGTVTEEPVHVVNAGVDPHAVQKYLFGQSPTTVDYECRAGA